MIKNKKISHKSKSFSKIEYLSKHRKFGQKSKILSKIGNLGRNWNFGEKSTFCSYIEILDKHQNFDRKSKFSPTTKLFGQKCLVNVEIYVKLWSVYVTTEKYLRSLHNRLLRDNNRSMQIHLGTNLKCKYMAYQSRIRYQNLFLKYFWLGE